MTNRDHTSQAARLPRHLLTTAARWAWAAWGSICLAHSALAGPGPSWLGDCAWTPEDGSACVQPFSQGLAAVRLVVPSHDEGRWGFVNEAGQLVIGPGYDEVRPFAQGLAAVRQDGLWGYINTQGRWVIEPRYQAASSFTPEGSAMVQWPKGQVQRIGPQGEVRQRWPARARMALHGDVQPATGWLDVSVHPRMQLIRLRDGQALALPSAVEHVGMPQDGLIPASRTLADGSLGWGLLHMPPTSPTKGQALQGASTVAQPWALPPERLPGVSEAPLHHAGVVAVRRDGRWAFVDLQGQPMGAWSAREVELLRPGVWHVTDPQGQQALLDARLQTLRSLPDDTQFTPSLGFGQWVVSEHKGEVLAVGPHGQIRTWPSAPGVQVEVWHDHLWILPDVVIDYEDPAAQGQALQDRLRLTQVIRPDGQPLLDEATRARLMAYQITPIGIADAPDAPPPPLPMALAWLKPLEAGAAPAILTHEGRIVTHPDWLALRVGHRGAAPWVVQTRQGLFGAINGQGQWLVQPQWLGLSDFEQGHAWGRRADIDGGQRHVLVASDGRLRDTPAFVSQDCARWLGAMLTCMEARADQNVPYLWDPVAGQRRPLADLDEVQPQAWAPVYKVQQAGRWGLMGSQAQWLVPPSVQAAQKLSLLDAQLVQQERYDAEEGERFALYSLRDGQLLAPPGPKRPERLGHDRYAVFSLEQGTRLIDAQGQTLYSTPWIADSVQAEEGWVKLSFDPLHGWMDAQGQWRVPASHPYLHGVPLPPHEPRPAQQASALSLLERRGQRLFVDPQGRAQVSIGTQCGQVAVRDAQGRQAWPPEPLRCAPIARKGAPR